MQRTAAFLLVILTGCRQVIGIEDPVAVTGDATTDDAAPGASDAPVVVDAVPVDAAPLGAWGTPMRALPDTPTADDDPSLTEDMLELYLERSSAIFRSTRASTAVPWPAPTVVAELDDPAAVDGTPAVSRDGLTMLFASNRSPSAGAFDIWQSTRTARTQPWGAPTRIASLSTAEDDVFGGVGEDGLTGVLTRRPTAGSPFTLYLTQRTTPLMDWQAPTPLTSVNPGNSPALAGPGMTLYFDSNRGGDFDIYVAEPVNGEYSAATPELAPGLTSTGSDTDPWVSSDQRTIYFTSTREGGQPKVFWATR